MNRRGSLPRAGRFACGCLADSSFDSPRLAQDDRKVASSAFLPETAAERHKARSGLRGDGRQRRRAVAGCCLTGRLETEPGFDGEAAGFLRCLTRPTGGGRW